MQRKPFANKSGCLVCNLDVYRGQHGYHVDGGKIWQQRPWCKSQPCWFHHRLCRALLRLQVLWQHLFRDRPLQCHCHFRGANRKVDRSASQDMLGGQSSMEPELEYMCGVGLQCLPHCWVLALTQELFIWLQPPETRMSRQKYCATQKSVFTSHRSYAAGSNVARKFWKRIGCGSLERSNTSKRICSEANTRGRV